MARLRNPWIEYLEPVPADKIKVPPQFPPQQPQHGAGKYHGSVASGYDAKRIDSPKWTIEQRIIEEMLDELPEGAVVLDCPFGTGRFIEIAGRKHFTMIGIDRQSDMLNEAVKKIARGLGNGASFSLGIGDALNNGLPDKSVDAALAIRVTRWIIEEHGPEGIVKLMKEMQRVARRKIITTIRTGRVRPHPYAVTRELVESALDGWAIHNDAEGYEADYRILDLRCSPS